MQPKWLAVLLLSLAGCVNYADRAAISAVFPLLRRDLGMTDVQLGAVGSYFLWSYALASPLAGLLADRVSRVRLIVVSLAAWSLVTIISGMARTAEELLWTRALLGLVECAYLPAAVGLLADHHGIGSRARALAIHSSGIAFGLIVGASVAGGMGETYGWRPSLYLLGVAGLLLAAVCAFFLPNAQTIRPPAATSNRPSFADQLLLLLRTPSYLFLMVQGLLIAVGTWIFVNWLPLYFSETYRTSLTIAGLSGTVPLTLAAIAGLLVGSAISDSNSQRRMLVMVVCYVVAGPVLLLLLSNFPILIASSIVIVFSMIRSIGMSNEHPHLCDVLPPQNRSAGNGFMNMLNTLAGGTGVYVVGMLKKDYGWNGTFVGIAGLIWLAAVMAWLAHRTRPKIAANN